MNSQQHGLLSPVNIQVGESVMVRVPERSAKLSAKFVGPRLVVKQVQVNKSEILDPWLNTLEIIQSDRLKRTGAKPDLALVGTARICDATCLDAAKSQNTQTHSYNHHFCK